MDSRVAVSDSRGPTPALEAAGQFIARINDVLEIKVSTKLVTENILEKCWRQARKFEDRGPAYWLLLTRLAEATLLCAGNYADNGEFQAAGDLLVNPRQILVHSPAGERPTAKNRHGRLSDQFGQAGVRGSGFKKPFSAAIRPEITRPPLLPLITRVLREAGCISPAYLLQLEQGQHRIADALAFLAAWRIFDPAELWRKLAGASEKDRQYVGSNLCRFDMQTFHQIGCSLRQALTDPEHRSPFLDARHRAENGMQKISPADTWTHAGSPA
jgi:hypothetical protein